MGRRADGTEAEAAALAETVLLLLEPPSWNSVSARCRCVAEAEAAALAETVLLLLEPPSWNSVSARCRCVAEAEAAALAETVLLLLEPPSWNSVSVRCRCVAELMSQKLKQLPLTETVLLLLEPSVLELGLREVQVCRRADVAEAEAAAPRRDRPLVTGTLRPGTRSLRGADV